MKRVTDAFRRRYWRAFEEIRRRRQAEELEQPSEREELERLARERSEAETRSSR